MYNGGVNSPEEYHHESEKWFLFLAILVASPKEKPYCQASVLRFIIDEQVSILANPTAG
jgi:hypothetical protein